VQHGVEEEVDTLRGSEQGGGLGLGALPKKAESGARDGKDAVGLVGCGLRELDDFVADPSFRANEIKQVLDGFEGLGNLVRDDLRHAAPVFKLLS
jgi:hypothetical protein